MTEKIGYQVRVGNSLESATLGRILALQGREAGAQI